jgi:hypothetical protein
MDTHEMRQLVAEWTALPDRLARAVEAASDAIDRLCERLAVAAEAAAEAAATAAHAQHG